LNKKKITTNNLQGNSPNIQTQTVTEGGVLFNPILGNMLRTFHSVPQVTVSVNNVPSLCTSSSLCDFQWLQSSTPVVTNIDTSNKQAIVLTGTGFDLTNQNNKVLLGDVACTVTSASSTQLVCTPGNLNNSLYFT
jgi:hypothetical protein